MVPRTRISRLIFLRSQRQAAKERRPVLQYHIDSLLDASLWCAQESYVDASLPLLLTQVRLLSSTVASAFVR